MRLKKITIYIVKKIYLYILKIYKVQEFFYIAHGVKFDFKYQTTCIKLKIIKILPKV